MIFLLVAEDVHGGWRRIRRFFRKAKAKVAKVVKAVGTVKTVIDVAKAAGAAGLGRRSTDDVSIVLKCTCSTCSSNTEIELKIIQDFSTLISKSLHAVNP